MRAIKNASTAALVGIWTILLTAFVVTIHSVGRQLFIPLALAAMLTLLLAPLVAMADEAALFYEQGSGKFDKIDGK